MQCLIVLIEEIKCFGLFVNIGDKNKLMNEWIKVVERIHSSWKNVKLEIGITNFQIQSKLFQIFQH